MSKKPTTKETTSKHHHLSPLENQAIFDARARGAKVGDLSTLYHVSRQTIYNAIRATMENERGTSTSKENSSDVSPTPKRKRTRRLLAEVREGIAGLKRKYPTWGVAYLREHWMKQGHPPVSTASIYRILQDAGLQTRAQVEKEVYGRFEMAHPNQLWQMDIQGKLHLPGIGWIHGFAILDDCSRFSPGFRYFPDEKLSNGILLLNEAIESHGVPERLYTDNGSQFASRGERMNNFELFCAAHGIGITHTEPGRPQGKGKIERFYETVENQFIIQARAKINDTPKDPPYTIDDLNRDLITYIKDEYHVRIHGGTNETPAARFFREPRRAPSPPVDVMKFLERATARLTNKFGEVSYTGYKIQVGLPGHTRVVVVETIETIRIERDGVLVREINKKELSKEPPVKRQGSNEHAGVHQGKPGRVKKTVKKRVVRMDPARSPARESLEAKKMISYQADKDGLYYRTVSYDGRVKWMNTKYTIGRDHVNEIVSIQIVGNTLIVHDLDGNIMKEITTRNAKHEEVNNPVVEEKTPCEDEGAEIIPLVATTKPTITPDASFIAQVQDQDGLQHRIVCSAGKLSFKNKKYYFGKKHAGKRVLVREVDGAVHVFDENRNRLKILEIRIRKGG